VTLRCGPNQPRRPVRTQKIVIFDGPDGCGKTNIAQGLSMDLKVPYFRVTTQERNWEGDRFMQSLRFAEPMIVEMVRQLKLDVIFDRSYPAEWVYSQAYRRETDMEVLERVDRAFAEMGANIVIPLRRDYKGSRKDEFVSEEMLPVLHEGYLAFTRWTKCSSVVIYVDDFKNDLKREIEMIKPELKFDGDITFVTSVTLSREERVVDFGNMKAEYEKPQTIAEILGRLDVSKKVKRRKP
jgi:thymidylate kinase